MIAQYDIDRFELATMKTDGRACQHSKQILARTDDSQGLMILTGLADMSALGFRRTRSSGKTSKTLNSETASLKVVPKDSLVARQVVELVDAMNVLPLVSGRKAPAQVHSAFRRCESDLHLIDCESIPHLLPLLSWQVAMDWEQPADWCLPRVTAEPKRELVLGSQEWQRQNARAVCEILHNGI